MTNITNKNINHIFIWIIGVILLVFLLCCVTPVTYFKFFVPTPTLTPTNTPIPSPTIDVALSYVSNLKSFANRESSILNLIATTVRNATPANSKDKVWKNNLYSEFDDLISLSASAANLAVPSGWNSVQSSLIDIHKQFVSAKSSMIDFLDNGNQDASQKVVIDLNLANNDVQGIKDFIQMKGY